VLVVTRGGRHCNFHGRRARTGMVVEKNEGADADHGDKQGTNNEPKECV